MMFVEFSAESLTLKKDRLLNKLTENKFLLENLLKINKPDYYQFVYPYQKMNHDLDSIFTEISHIHSVKNSEESQNIYSELIPQITEYYTNLSQDVRIFNAYKSAMELADKEIIIDYSAIKVLRDGIRDFKLNGIDLPEKIKNRVKEINIQLAELSNQFSQNILNATLVYQKIIEDYESVQGIPESDLAIAKMEDGRWMFNLQTPSYLAYMTYGPNREIREELYEAYTTRAPENGSIITDIMSLRKELSSILGFKNYADYSLSFKMAESTQHVLDFLYDLADKARPQAMREFEELKDFAASKGIQNFQSHDLLFYSELLKKEKYQFDEEQYRPYFEKNQTVSGGLKFLEKLLGITFQKVDAQVWDPTVQVFNLEKSGLTIARLYCDLESRNNKKAGAWMHNWISKHRMDSETVPPIAFIVGNFPPSNEDTPSLLTLNDVVTFFHEMGHALHHLLTEIDHPNISGINGVEWDAVEFPSQFIENFTYTREALSYFAYHYITGEPIPDEMVQKMIDTKNFQSAMSVMRQLEYAIFDIKIHLECPDEIGVQNILNSVRSEIAVSIPPEYNRFQNGFSHIFSGGYAAGYYSYKWAELLSANAFIKLVENGIFESKLGEKFYREILAKGGSESALVLFKNFYEKDPELEPLLQLLDINS